MGFLSAIRKWSEKLGTIRLILTLSRQSPEQLVLFAQEMIQKEVEGNKWAVLNYATGWAITGWALMEDRLILIAALLLRADVEKAGLVFFSIISFHTRITIITELFELDQDFKSFQSRWNKLFERMRAESDYRDRLAHNYIMSEKVSENPLGMPIKITSRLDTRAKSKKSRPLSVAEVESFRRRIDAISDDVGKLLDEMNERARAIAAASRQKSSEQAHDQPSSGAR
jgi:hypothetical protein